MQSDLKLLQDIAEKIEEQDLWVQMTLDHVEKGGAMGVLPLHDLNQPKMPQTAGDARNCIFPEGWKPGTNMLGGASHLVNALYLAKNPS